MAPRRIGYSVRKLRSGRYQVLVRDPLTQKQFGVGTYASELEADRAGQQAAIDQHRRTWHDPRLGETPLSEYLGRWLDDRRSTGRHGARYSAEAYRLASKHIVPQLGPVLLVDLKAATVRAWYDGLVAERISAGKPVGLTPAKTYRLLHAALADAAADELIPKNPCIHRSAGVERSPERPLFEPQEIAAIAAEIKPWWSATVLVAGWCGLRLGEVQRLRRRDVDPLHGTLRVTKAKTAAGVRVVHIPAPLIPILEAHMGRWSEPGPAGLVFVGPKGGKINGGNFSDDFRAAREAAGIERGTFHDLRHAAGTMAAQLGASEREVMARLGHASPDAARRYQHAAERRSSELAAKLGAMFDASANAQPTRKPTKSSGDT